MPDISGRIGVSDKGIDVDRIEYMGYYYEVRYEENIVKRWENKRDDV